MRKNSKGFAQIIIVILLLILVVGAAYYFRKQKGWISFKPNPTPTITASTAIPAVKPAFVFNSLSKWTTYKVNNYGFSFDYPSNRFVVNFNSGEGDSSLEWVVSDKPLDINNTNDFIYALGQEGVFILPQATLKSYIDYAIQSGQYKELDDVSVGGKNAKVLTNIDTFGTGHRAYALETKSGLLIINIISDTKYLLYSEKFVNSFKFTN